MAYRLLVNRLIYTKLLGLQLFLLCSGQTYIDMETFNLNMIVHDLITICKTWDFHHLCQLFANDIIKLITAIPLSLGTWSDHLVWGSSKLMHVSLQNTRFLINIHNSQAMHVNCGWIWLLKV